MTARILLTQGKAALIDEADIELVAGYHWHLRAHEGGERYYVSRHIVTSAGKKSTESMHTLLTGWPLVDHINGDRACNRWSNLRDVAPSINSQNMRKAHKDNKTGFLGVRLDPSGMYFAELFIDGKNRRVGSSPTPQGAHDKYIAAKRQSHAGGTL